MVTRDSDSANTEHRGEADQPREQGNDQDQGRPDQYAAHTAYIGVVGVLSVDRAFAELAVSQV